MDFNFAKKEKEILKFWEKNKIPGKSLKKNKGKKVFVFYEGPPSANGRPGIHHVLARVFKDVVCRYKTMTGFFVPRKAGWDTHGLPVELQTEKELQMNSKKDIEKYGISKFNKKCKELVWSYKEEWEDLTDRIGFWLDVKTPYITYSNDYIETLFYIIKQFWKRGLLYREVKVVPWCPRCQTSLSSHEVSLGYKKIKENSIYVKLKVDILDTYLLVWTTTPWTLPGNVAVAFNPKIKYVLATKNKSKEKYILAKERLISVFGKKNYKILKDLKEKDILNLKYEPLFPKRFKKQDKAWKAYPADFVSTEEGTGFVHVAPAFGEDDFQVAKKNDLPRLLTIDEDGKMKRGVIGEGKFAKEADKDIIDNLKKRKLLLGEEEYEHDYPFCWRCDTPLLYYLRSSWFVATKKIKKKILENNKKINWHPEYLKNGRFGNFLEDLRDWNFSRERYWGTPLPVWQCKKCNKIEVIGSREDLLLKKFSSNRYFFLRHGFSETNKKRIINADPKAKHSLTKLGKSQIKKAVENLKKMLKDEKLDVILSSDLLRTKESAEIVKKEIKFKGKIFFDSKLREIKFGDWEGKKLEDFKKEFLVPPENFFSRGPKGGENWSDCKKRMLQFIEKVEKKYKGKNILIVGHGDPLWLLGSAMKGIGKKELLRTREGEAGYFEKGELREIKYTRFPFDENGNLDFHRPYIDNVLFKCEKCDSEMKRVKEVCDVWFDSGAMPFAQANWPFNKNKKTAPPKLFPADFICEGIDQTRGWFYTLLVVSSLLEFGSSYKNVLSTGLVLDKHGKKMSKSKGNVVNPWEVVKKYGADSLRWYFYTINQPWDFKNFDEIELKKCFNRFISTFLNSLFFYKTYAKANKILKPKSKNLLDKWILSRLQNLLLEVTDNLENYRIVFASRKIEDFVINELSNWYIRRSRSRFQNPRSKKEIIEASATLGFVLAELSKISSIFVPFLSEEVYKSIYKNKKTSVHLTDYPKKKKEFINKALEKEMAKIQEIVVLALSKRKEAQIKVRQPLQRLKLKEKIKKEFFDLIKEEINVKEIVFDPKIKSKIELDTKITKELKEEGILRDIIRFIQDTRKRAGLKKENIVEINYTAEKKISFVIQNKKEIIGEKVLAKKILEKKEKEYIIEKETILDGKNFWIGIRKI